ncbi:MAG: chloride channel protein [Ilumatobacter sp.]|uniref:chloride channel protein n=1 Tax=Ilumatobacter sp. TaxID=1967498 RepID=UPI003298A8AC
MPRSLPRDQLNRFFGIRSRTVALIVVIGFGGGALGAAYLFVLDVLSEHIGPEQWNDGGQIAVLVVTGVIVSLLVKLLGRTADVELLVGNIHVPGTTDPGTSASGPDSGGRLRALIPVSLLCIGAGGTLGPEAPLVTMTGTLASRLARRSGLNTSDRRVLAITGMAAGFTVLFGAPLGAAVFALEIPHRRGLEYYEAIVPAVIGALCGFAVSTTFGGFGLEPLWNLPSVNMVDGVDLAWAVVAGVLGAAIGLTFTLLVGVLRRVTMRVPPSVRPAAGGLVLGTLALVSPGALTNGEVQIIALGSTDPLTATLLVAGLAKLAAAAVALVTGWRGGFIIPLFFTGYTLGRVAADWLGIDHTWMFVAATMVAANVAVTKTPIGSTLVVTEMSGLTLGPVTIIGALTSLVLTSPIGLIDNQRRRFDVYEPMGGETESSTA